jgi:hypothetical protein
MTKKTVKWHWLPRDDALFEGTLITSAREKNLTYDYQFHFPHVQRKPTNEKKQFHPAGGDRIGRFPHRERHAGRG